MDATQVDTADGEKIVGHVFGGQQDQVAAQLAGTANLGGIGGDVIRKALPILAPIVMSYLAKKIFWPRRTRRRRGRAGPAELAAGRPEASTSAASWAESSEPAQEQEPERVLVVAPARAALCPALGGHPG